MMSEWDDIDETLKIVMVGCSGMLWSRAGVGKTSLISRYVTFAFDVNTVPTVGGVFVSKKTHRNGKIYKIRLWDTAGQEKFRAITPLFFRDANGIFLVCDLTSQSSFSTLNEWIKMVKDHCPRNVRKPVSRSNYNTGEQDRQTRELQGIVG